MGESYEIFKTEIRFRSRNKLYFIYKYCWYFSKQNCFKTENFHPCICVYSPDFIHT